MGKTSAFDEDGNRLWTDVTRIFHHYFMERQYAQESEGNLTTEPRKGTS